MNNFCSQIVSDAAGWGVWGLARRVQEVGGESTLKGMKRHTTWILLKGIKWHTLYVCSYTYMQRDEGTPLGSWKTYSPKNLLTDSGFLT